MEQSFRKKTSFVSGGINSTATQLHRFSATMLISTKILNQAHKADNRVHKLALAQESALLLQHQVLAHRMTSSEEQAPEQVHIQQQADQQVQQQTFQQVQLAHTQVQGQRVHIQERQLGRQHLIQAQEQVQLTHTSHLQPVIQAHKVHKDLILKLDQMCHQRRINLHRLHRAVSHRVRMMHLIQQQVNHHATIFHHDEAKRERRES